ncbi:uncharacterized protein PAC_05226 [Phialocephala subalpina]|uniref:Isochorismatase-like domain-containing protein n=1 Tax=Phialocephala subalpina TaxID=576137 RepID=A0A1L7WRF6_9HELO|nr:uncharacterized protein PAC_05226 [Phialocephala subalpina]
MTTALLILDVQAGVVPRLPSLAPTYLPRLAHTINTARSGGVKIIYVHTCFRASHPEISSSNPIFSKFLNSNSSRHPPLAPRLIIRYRSHQTTSQCVLRRLVVRKLVLVGMATSSAVSATAFEACDRDLEVTALSDLSVDREEETNRIVLEKVIGKLGRVVDAGIWVEELSRGRREVGE